MLKHLWFMMKGNKTKYLLSVTYIAIATLFSMMLPLILKFILDVVILEDLSSTSPFLKNLIDYSTIQFLRTNLWIFIVITVFIAVLEGTFNYLNVLLSAKACENISKNLKDRLFSHIQNLPFIYHLNSQTGDLIQRCTSDVENIRSFFQKEIKELGKALFTISLSTIILLNYSYKLTIVSIFFMPLIFVISFLFFIRINKIFFNVQDKEATLTTILQENLSGIRIVKAFGNQKFEIDKFDEINEKHTLTHRKLTINHAFFWSSTDIICLFQIAIVFFYGIYMVSKGEITLGVLIVFYGYVNQFIWPVRRMGRILMEIGKVKVSVDRIYNILDKNDETDTSEICYKNLKGDIILKDLDFEYVDGIKVLNNINMTIKNGETVAILGNTGSGKSTLVLILLKLLEYTKGSITINGLDLKTIDKKCLRQRIGLILQESFLFSRTIKENIKMAKSEATEEEIKKVCETAHIYNTIKNFDKGFETIVGERGVTLSGGQKQRLAIARTLIRDNDILIFDDSLSAVDTVTDRNIRKELVKDTKTKIIISQRITTVMGADKIYILENGKITASGTHKELINKEGFYAKIWDIQRKIEEDLNGQ